MVPLTIEMKTHHPAFWRKRFRYSLRELPEISNLHGTARVVGTIFHTEENDCGVRVRPDLGAVNRETVIDKMVGIFIRAVRERP